MDSQSLEKAYNYAIYILGLKLRTKGEISEKLRSKKYNAEVIETVVRRLLENKYIDDLQYAQVYLENLKQYKNFGYYGIKKKFMERRLPSSIIETVLSEGLTVEEEIKIANRFIKKNPIVDKNKTAQKLKSRGFRSEVIFKLFN